MFSSAFGGLIAAGLINMDGVHGVAGWKWIFVMEGLLTMLVALYTFFALPDFPENSPALTPAERALAVDRLTVDGGESDRLTDFHGAKEGLKLAFKDPICYLFTLMLSCTTLGDSFSHVFPTLIATLKYSSTVTLLITAGPWCFGWVCLLANSWHATKVNARFWHIVRPLSAAIVGLTMCASTMALPVRFIGFFLAMLAFCGHVMVYAWLSTSIPRPAYKRSVAIGGINGFAQISNVCGGYVYSKAKYGPRYWQSFLVSICAYLLAIIAAFLIRRRLQALNRKLDEMYGAVEEIEERERRNPTMNDPEIVKSKFRFIV